MIQRTIEQRAAKTKVSPIKSAAPEVTEFGNIDFYGYVDGIIGWFFTGWTERSSEGLEDCVAIARFERGGIGGKARVVCFPRADLEKFASRATGVIVFVPATGRITGNLVDLRLQFGEQSLLVRTDRTTRRVSENEVVNEVRLILIESATADQNRLYLLRLITRPMYRGEDSIASLPESVFIELDEIILCPPSGLLMMGWRLGGANAGYCLRLRSGQLNTEFFPERGVRIPRPDVLEAIGQERGFVDLDCGFMAYLPNAYSAGETTYLEIETATGAIAFKTIRVSHKRGMEAIKRILAAIDVRGGAVDACFDQVVGPAVAALHRDRMRAPVEVVEVSFGTQSVAPIHSIVVPLFGRVDFIECQMAQFSGDQGARDYEVIYVLDDPPRRRELENLAQSVFARFEVPFRLLFLSRNLGFAPASNIGLKAARGKYVCFLNSDVFPKTVDWLQLLTDRLKAHPDIGAIGARLLYEDGSVQHEGCAYKAMPELGGWSFVTHENKSRRPDAAGGLRYAQAVTGACIVMEHALASELGGFDEAYVVGDFEDSDLCMKIRQRGLQCAVDLDVRLFHLERKSQASSNHNWRQNLTLYNAWVHQRRWIAALTAAAQVPRGVER